MRVIVTGITGQLGSSLKDTAPVGVDFVGVNRAALDLADPGSLQSRLKDLKPDIVVNAGAYTAVDKAENEPELAKVVNADSVKEMVAYCRQTNTRLVQVSTDFVFAGEASSPYIVQAKTKPLGVYGETKLAAEQHVLAGRLNCQIVRTGWVYSEHGHNFVKTMLRLGAQRAQIAVVSDQVGSPTYARNLAKMIWALLDSRSQKKMFHFSDAGVASWYDLAIAVFELAAEARMLDKIPYVKPIRAVDYPTPARRPAFSVLDKTETWMELSVNPEHWRVALASMLNRLQISN